MPRSTFLRVCYEALAPPRVRSRRPRARLHARLPRSQDPVYSVETAMTKLAGAWPSVQRALADARHRLVYGVGDPLQLLNTSAAASAASTDRAAPAAGFGEVASLVLLEVVRAQGAAAAAQASRAPRPAPGGSYLGYAAGGGAGGGG